MRKKERNIIGNVSRWLAIPIFLILSGLFTVGRAEIYGNFTYSTDGASVTITKYTGSEASVTIPDFIRGTTVSNISNSAFKECTSLTNVIIGTYVASIGDWAFAGCTGLKKVVIPDGVTSIGEQAFHNCTGLTSVTFGKSVGNFGIGAFSSCNGLTNITIPDNVTNLGFQVFAGCSSLRIVVIGNGVTKIGDGAFAGCPSLKNVTIPNSVTNIGNGTFANCTSLQNITIPNSVAIIGPSAFEFCRNLTNATLPSSITSIGSYAFRSCTSLTSVTLPNSVTNMGDWTFSGCSSLQNVVVGNGITKIWDWTFAYCSALTSVTFGNSVTIIEGYDVFYECSKLRMVYFAGDIPTFFPAGLFYSAKDVTVRYRAETTGWGPTFGGRPTALWIQQPPYQEWATSVGLRDKFPAASGDMDDPDQDGLNNLQEWQAGTDPTNPNSALKYEFKPRLADLEDGDKTPLNPGEFALYLQTMPYRQYDIQSATSIGGTWQTEVTVSTTTTQKRILVYKGLDKVLYRAVLVP